MKTSPWTGTVESVRNAFLVLLAATLAVPAQAQALVSDQDAYFPGETIRIQFSGGPGNSKDWIGVYPEGAVPGGPASTLWNYVDGTRSGAVGLREGVVEFPGGLSSPGSWNAFLLLNDGYDVLTNLTFTVLEPTAAAVRTDQRSYAPGAPITVTFTNGPANAKDWIGVYRSGQVPGGPASTIWSYVDGTRSGTTGLASGSVAFPTGLADAGTYDVYLLNNDGYEVLAVAHLTVAAPVAAGPRVLSVSPSSGASGVLADAPFLASVTNGVGASVATSTVRLLLDGVPVTPSVSVVSGLVTVAHTNAALLAPGSSHEYRFSFSDTGSPAGTQSFTNAFTVMAYRDIRLPAPIVFEDFDSVAEGGVPPGWTRELHSAVETPEFDLGNLDSATYAEWTVVNAARFGGTFVTYSDPTSPAGWQSDYQRVNRPNPANVVNGRVLREPLASGRLLFGNSGYRRGSGQVLYAYSPDFNLAGKTDVHLSFHSLWEQNQDSLASVEYSIDGGTTWKPVAYYLVGSDIVRTEAGDVDAVATFSTALGDLPVYTDGTTGQEVGGTYGAYIGATVDASLAPFVEARIDDDPVSSKRVELYRLPLADNQPRVRLRFAHVGSDSWYWGIDDLGLYSIPQDAGPVPNLVATRTASGLRLDWTSAAGVVLESNDSLAASGWTAVSGVTGNSAEIPATAAARFYRLRRP